MDLTLFLNPTLIIGIITGTISAAIIFYLKDYLQERSNYLKFKKKIENLVGTGATVIYNPNIDGTLGSREYKIIEITKQGIILQDKLNKIFVPMEKLIETDIILPSDNYEYLKMEELKRNFSKMMDAMIPPMLSKFKEVFIEEFLDSGSDLSAIVAIKVNKELIEQGVRTSEPEKFKTPRFREIFELIDKFEDTKTKEDDVKKEKIGKKVEK